jgi:energy-coupling factor transporter ATP-binding protein EcfA2
MISRVKINNFRGFGVPETVNTFTKEKGERVKSWSIDLELKPITILIGRNSAGKSSFVKFLLMLLQSLESFEADEFIVTDGRHVSLGEFPSLRNNKASANSKLEFEVFVERTNLLPSDSVHLLYQKLKESQPVKDMSDENFNTYLLKLNKGNIESFNNQLNQIDIARITCNAPYGTVQSKKGTGYHSVTLTRNEIEMFKVSTTNFKSSKFLNFGIGEDQESILKNSLNEQYLKNLRKEFFGIKHVGPVRQDSQESIVLTGLPTRYVGHSGQFAIPHLKNVYQNGTPEQQQLINKHLESVLDIENISFENKSGMVTQVFAINKTTKAKVLLGNFGFGVSQCLPIFVQGALMNPEELFIVEQPEAQLHPTAQLEMGSFFADLWNEHKVPSLVETHSSNIILRLRKLIAKKKLKAKDVSIAYFHTENGKVKIKNIQIFPDGRLEKGLPLEFFGADVLEAMEMNAAGAEDEE